MKKNQAKNIPKNIMKAIVKYVLLKENEVLMALDNSKSDQQLFISELEKLKKQVFSIN